MKASNKVLLILFATIGGYIILSHLVLRAKWQKGDFAKPGSSAFSIYEEHPLPSFKYLKLIGLSDCKLISSVSPRLEIEKGIFDFVKYHVVGDTLVVDGSLKAEQRSSFSNGQTPQRVKIFLPQLSGIQSLNSRVEVKGERDEQKSRQYDILLVESTLNTRRYYDLDSLPRYFDSFKVRATNHSEVYLYRKDHFKDMDIDLAQSNFYGRNAKGDKIGIRADSSSMVVSGGNDFQLIIAR